MAKTDIVIVNWNTSNLLEKCLLSLLQLGHEEKDLIGDVYVVDNDSQKDDSFAQAQQAVAGRQGINFVFIQSGANLGFVGGNNLALEKIQQKTATPHVFLLNPDTEVKTGALTAMLKVFAERADVGIVGPKLLNPDGSLQFSVRPFPKLLDFVLYMLKLGRVVQSKQERSHNYDDAGYVDQVMGAAFMIRDECFKKIGLLDKNIFQLFEEVDYAYRAMQSGWKSFYTPSAQVMHVKAVSFNQLIGFKRSLPWLKSASIYAKKHLGQGTWLLMMALFPVSLVLTIPATIKHWILSKLNTKRL